MNALGATLFIACAIALLTLPRRWAAVPLLAGCCYITAGQGLMLGTFSLPVYRMLLLVGVIRLVIRGERPTGGVTTGDKLMLGWSAWTMFASLFQPYEPGSGPQYVASAVFTVAASYVVMRALCRDLDDVKHVLRCLCVILAPVAAAMVYELLTNRNLYAVFGRVPEVSLTRGGRIRAQGPFSHPILAGTIGATCFPFVLIIWSRYRIAALIGAAACLLMVFSSASSGPIMSLIFGGFAVAMWRYQHLCAKLRTAAVIVYLLLLVVMERAPYYLISKIDLTGSSTGWHRSHLIHQTIAYFNEWALFGTNRTRHWMPNQGAISENHTDITNYYISFAVLGGFLCMAFVVAMLWRAFKSVGEVVGHPLTTRPEAFAVWCLGATLFAHAMSSLSIAYFGQTPVFFWLPVAMIATLHAGLSTARVPVKRRAPAPRYTTRKPIGIAGT